MKSLIHSILVLSVVLVIVISYGCTDKDQCADISCENGGTCIDGVCDCPDGYSGTTCAQVEQEEQATLELRTAFGSVSSLSVDTQGIFAIWWDPKFDHSSDVPLIFDRLQAIRSDCLERLLMQDPPNPAQGYFYNVYIHHGADDLFPTGWGNGQGTDRFGTPFLTLPHEIIHDENNTFHEGFHIFQYASDSPGFAYAGDSQWYIEASAQWYMTKQNPTNDYIFRESMAKAENPQLALWHSFSNRAPGDPINWLYEVQQYGLQSLLYYISVIRGEDPSHVSSGFYGGVNMLPQEYLYTKIGGELFRDLFADWAAHNAGGFDYLSPAQIDIAKNEVAYFAKEHPESLHRYALELTDEGTQGSFSPKSEYRPRGWGYNVIKISNSKAATYTFDFEGEETGSESASAYFGARVVIHGSDGVRYETVDLTNGLIGSISVAAEASDREVNFVVAALPEHFGGNQTYNYSLQVERKKL